MEEGTSDEVIGKSVEKYNMMLNNLENYLPFLKRVMESSCQLNIEKENLEKLRILYKMIKSRKYLFCLDLPCDLWLMNEQLNSCQRVVESLFAKYNKLLTEKEEIHVTNDSEHLIQIKEDEIKTKSTVTKLTSNINDQIPNGYVEHANELLTDSQIENSNSMQIDDLSCNKNLNKDDSLPTKIDLPEFSDSRLRLNKVIGFAANASIEKLNIYDTTISHSDLAKQIFDDLNKHKNGVNLCKNMLKGIDMNDIDVNDVKEVIESLKKTETEFVQPAKLPPSELMDLKTTSEIVLPVKPSGEYGIHNSIKTSAPQFTSSLVPNKTIREKLNSDIDIVHKIGSSNVSKKQFITALKPGTLIDLEKSKVARTSLYIDSHRSANRSSEQFMGIKPSVDIAIPRDPRIRNKSLQTPIHSSNLIKPLLQMNIQQPVPIMHNNFLPKGHINNTVSQQELSHNTLSGYNEPNNFQRLSSHNNMQPYNKLIPTEHVGNINQSQLNNSKLPIQHQYKHNYNDIAIDNQKIEMTMKYHEPGSSTYYRNNAISIRDPRSMKNNNHKTPHEPIYYSYKKHREAKLANEKHKEFTKSKKDQEYLKMNFKTITDTNNLYTSFGVTNESANIKNFKIPKIKRKEDTIDKIMSTNEENGIKGDIVVKDFDTEIVENKIDKVTKTEIVDNDLSQEKKCLLNDSSVSNDEVNIETQSNQILNVLKKVPKKPKKYSNEKEFEKIVKEAVVESLNSDLVHGPRIKTRSLKKKEPIKNIELNKVKNNITDGKNDPFLGECSKNPINKLNTENLDRSIETGQNVISSTSKESTDVDSSVEVICESHRDDLVSSTEINSTADDAATSIPKCDDSLIDILRCNPGVMAMLNYFNEKRNHIEKLVKDNNIDQYKNIEPLNNSKRKKSKKNKKRKKKKIVKSVLPEDEMSENNTTNETQFSCISDDNNLNEEYNKSLNPNLTTLPIVDFSDDYITISKNDQSSTVTPKLNKYNNSDHVEILRNKYSAELKDLKIVITKYDKRSDDATLNIQTNVQPTNRPVENKIQKLKPHKKIFLGPLSVKLAKQKMEVEQNSSHDQIKKNTEIELETNKRIISKKKKCSRKNRKNTKRAKILANTVDQMNACVQQPYVVLESIESISSKFDQSVTDSKSDLLNENDLVKQNPNKLTTITIDSNVNDIKSGIRKPKMTELDKLHADINENCAAVLNVSNVRHCRTNKQINYVNTNISFPMKNTIPSIKQNVDVKKSKVKKKVKNITLKLNKNKHLIKNDNINDMSHMTINNSIANKKSNILRPSKFKKSKSKVYKVNLRKKQLMHLAKVNSCEISQLSNQGNTEGGIKLLMDYDYKDQLYFQTANNTLECKYCNYNDTGLNIVRHYKELHSEKEVLPSRLSKSTAELLISESLKENYSYEYFDDSKLLGSVRSYFTCVFCQVIFYDYVLFYDHITCHTGEYRYACEVCSKTYPNGNELEKHISEHSVYIKANNNENQLQPDLIKRNILFGYLCSFCYYVQLSYVNMEQHMSLCHEKEDKKCNGHWTILRISMSVGNENCNSTIINYTNLIGCLPPTENEHGISGPIIISKCKELHVDAESKIYEVNVKEDLTKYSSESKICQFSPKLSISNNSQISEDSSDIEYIEYALKDNIKKYTVANLSCELIINSVLLYKCSVLRCALNQFSTVILMDFFKHIELNHQQVIWDNKCDFCNHKVENIKEEYFLKDALNHLISHHLVLKNNEKPNTSNVVDLKNKQDLTIVNQDTVKITTLDLNPLKPLRLRKLSGDTLSISKANLPEQKFPNNLCISEESNDTNSNLKDLDETMNEDLAKEIIIKNSEQLNPFEKPADHTKITTDSSFSLLDPPIVNVVSLKEINVKKIETSNISQNDDISMWMKVKTLREIVLPNSNIFLEPGQQIVNNGQPIHGTYCLIDTEYKKCYSKKVREFPLSKMKTRLALSDMLTSPRSLGLFKCMDRTCTKIFNDKDLFKLHMRLHFSNSEKKKKNQTHKIEQFKICAYCYKTFDDEESLANHIAEKYAFCSYFCPNCFYRAYTASHVLVHQSTIHNNIKASILKLEYDDINESSKEILLAVDFNEFVLPYVCNVGHCTYSCYVSSNFVSHLNQGHQQCDKFCCYICAQNDNGKGFFALQPKLMMKHFKLHNINLYQCIFCIFGTEVIDSMIGHLAMEHYEYEPICVERSLMPNCYDATKIENLKVTKVQKVIDNGLVKVINIPSGTSSLPEILLNKTKKKHSDVHTSVIKSSHINNNTQSLDTIVITVPDRAQMENTSLTLPVDNDFIMLDNDSNQNIAHKKLKMHNIWSKSKDNNTEPPHILNDDVIIIDDDDDDDNDDMLVNNTSNTRDHSIISNKQKRLALPIIPLDKLFLCKECDQTFSTSDEFYSHLWNNCPFWNSNGRKCTFCNKSFKTVSNLIEHSLLHGPDRLKCSLCNIILPSNHAITHHLKNEHAITKYTFVPIHSNLTNINKDEFIVYEEDTLKQTKSSKVQFNFICSECSYSVSTKKLILSHMKDIHNINENDICPVNSLSKSELIEEYIMQRIKPNIFNLQQQCAGLKVKPINSNNIDSQTESPKTVDIIENKTKSCLFFSPDTIDNVPKSHIFSEPIGCLLCEFNSKVRSNLILHLNGHVKGQDNTSKEIVNPVPSIGKSELMFDKMINLSASSFEAMNSEKMRIDEINLKIVEVSPHNNLNMELYPTFIPIIKRFKCSVCAYIGMNEDMLKKHISINHQDHHCYLCPHCKPESPTKIVELNNIEFHLLHHGENLYKCQYCDYIDFNRDEMKIHMRHIHLLQLTTTSQSNIIVIRRSMLKDDIIDRCRYQAQAVTSQWICNICSSGMKYTQNEITSHILLAHKISNMFKCPMCEFEHCDDNAKVFEDHYKSKHPSVAVKCLKVFEKIVNIEELPKQIKCDNPNIQEQQALESIDPTLMSTCRGIPVDSISISKSHNKSRGVSKSPKKISKTSPVKVRKQKILVDDFKEDDSFGTISANGSFACPKCKVFETMSVNCFREHLYKEINYKIWRCSMCSEISDSPKKMAWHVKKHGVGLYKYEKVENADKFKWVERVIVYQNSLLHELNNDQNTIAECDNNSINSTLIKNQNIHSEKKLSASTSTTRQFTNDIINLLDDSDSE